MKASFFLAMVVIFNASLFGAFLGYGIIRQRRLRKHLYLFAQSMKLSRLRWRWFRTGRGFSGLWNQMEVRFCINPGGPMVHKNRGGVSLIASEIRLAVSQERFYLQNRTLPLLYDLELRPVRYTWLPKRLVFPQRADESLFVAHATNSETLDKILASPAGRQHILKNLIDEEGELILEGGWLRVFRTTRMKISHRNPASFERLDDIFREEWELLRTVVAILKPLRLTVSDREALTLHCPFCKSELLELLSLVKCSQCKTLHHQNCWEENAHCSIFGCNGVALPYIKDSTASKVH